MVPGRWLWSEAVVCGLWSVAGRWAVVLYHAPGDLLQPSKSYHNYGVFSEYLTMLKGHPLKVSDACNKNFCLSTDTAYFLT